MIDNESWDLPFQALPGETHECTYSSKENHVNLTNYRLIICLPETFYVVSIFLSSFTVGMLMILDIYLISMTAMLL